MAKSQKKAKQMLNEQEESNGLDLATIVGLCISNWYWFVLCLLITCSISALYIRITPPVFVRSTSIVVKVDEEGAALDNVFTKFRNGKDIMSESSLNNEMIALRKASIMEKVIERLNLDICYQIRGHLRTTDLYGSSLPITAEFSNKNVMTQFKLQWEEGNDITLRWDEEHSNGNGTLKIKAKVGVPVKTPFGTITIHPTQAYNSKVSDDITITKISKDGATGMYLGKLTVANTDEKSSVIDLSLNDVNIERADDVLNTLIAVYNEQWIENRNQIIVATNKFINARLVSLESELGDVESEMSNYQISNHTLDLTQEGEHFMERSYDYDNQGLTLENELTLTKYLRNYISKVRDYERTLPLSAGINNPALQQQVNQYNGLVLDRSNLISSSTDTNPLVNDFTKQLEVLKKGIIATLDSHIAMLNSQANMLHNNNAKNNVEIDKTPSKTKLYVDIDRRRKIKEQLYTYLLQTREQNELNQAFAAYNTRVLEPSSGSSQQTYPNTKKIWIIAFSLGLGLPLAFIIIRELANSKVRGRKDIEKMTIPFVGELPLMEFPDENKTSIIKRISDTLKGYFSSSGHKKHKKSKAHIVVKPGSRNVINEAFRVLRTNVEFMIGQNKDIKVIMTTSANPGSGKTFISYNLALCMSLKGKRVCAIDLDLRRRSLSEYVGKPEKGVSDYINGAVDDWHDVLIKAGGSDSFYILPVGTLPPNPAEIISYDRFGEMIQEIRKEFDYVFFDCPPVEVVADTSILAKHADISLFVIRVGLMELAFRPIIEEYYADQRFNNMGVILNGTLTANSRYGYRRYGYRYGYGYGYGYGGYYYGDGYSQGYSKGFDK